MRYLRLKIEAFKFAWGTAADQAFFPQNLFFVNNTVKCLRSRTFIQVTKTTYTTVNESLY